MTIISPLSIAFYIIGLNFVIEGFKKDNVIKWVSGFILCFIAGLVTEI